MSGCFTDAILCKDFGGEKTGGCATICFAGLVMEALTVGGFTVLVGVAAGLCLMDT